MAKAFTMFLGLPLKDAADRVYGAVDPEVAIPFSTRRFDGDRPVLGHVGATGFRLQVRRSYRNHFASHLFGTFSATPVGCRLDGVFGFHPLVRVLLAIWFSFVAFFAAAGVIASSGMLGAAPEETSAMLVVSVFMMGIGVLGAFVGRRISRPEEAFLKEFLENLFDGVRIEGKKEPGEGRP